MINSNSIKDINSGEYLEFLFLNKKFFRGKINFNFKRGRMETVSAERGKISQIAAFTYYFLLLSSIIALIFTWKQFFYKKQYTAKDGISFVHY